MNDIRDVAQRYLIDQVRKMSAVAVLGEKKDWATPEEGWDVFPLNIEPDEPEKVKL